jgi:hypothetical protein
MDEHAARLQALRRNANRFQVLFGSKLRLTDLRLVERRISQRLMLTRLKFGGHSSATDIIFPERPGAQP